MASNPQDLSSAPNESERDGGELWLNNDDFPSIDPSDNAFLDEWIHGIQGDGLDMIPSLPAQTSTHQEAPDVVDQHAPGTLATSLSNIPLGNNSNNDLLPLNHSNQVDFVFDEWVQGFDTTSSLPAQTSTHQGAPNVVDQHAPGTSATTFFNTPFGNNRKVLSGETSSPPPQDSESPGTLSAAGAEGPTSLGPKTPKKRKRSNEEEASPPSAPKTRKRKRRNPTRHDFPQKGSPSMIIDGQPCYVAPAGVSSGSKTTVAADGLCDFHTPSPSASKTHKRKRRNSTRHDSSQKGSPSTIINGQPCYVAPAGVPSGSKTTVAADALSDFHNSERYLDSNRMRQMVKNGLADSVGIVEGDKWQCRLPGGMYRIECLGGGLCSMQWLGEVVYV